jgi:hypothetical protein
MSERPHYRLDAWKEAMSLVRTIYEVTRAFPKEELYGLTQQMRRAAVSVPSNLAEGAAPLAGKSFPSSSVLPRVRSASWKPSY